jgi:hypothetical protein
MKRLLFLIIIAAYLSSCNNSESGSEAEVADSFLLKANPELKNYADLTGIETNIAELKASLAKGQQGEFGQGPIFPDAVRVNLKQAVAGLFDPDSTPCTLPSKVAKKLRSLKEKGKNWAPDYVAHFMNSLPDSALFLPRTSLSILLHTVGIKSTNGNVRSFPLTGAATFKNLDIDNFIVKQGFDVIMYTLDCSGYLNAALQVSATVPGADITSSAKAALDKKTSMFVGGGVMMSPIDVAYRGDVLGVDMDTATRIQILKLLLNLPDIEATDSILTPVSYEVVWASTEGNSSFNGEATLEGKVGVGIGVASFSTSGKANGKLTRSSEFSSYKTYFTNRKPIPQLKPFTLADVQKVLTALSGKDKGK